MLGLAQSKEEKLKSIIKKVACPLGRMENDENQIYCSEYPYWDIPGKKPKISLGDIEADILNHCSQCKGCLKGLKDKKEGEIVFKNVKISEYSEVACAASGTNVDVQTTCLKCPYLNRKALKAQNPDQEVDTIPCCFPNLPKESMKMFLDAKTKRAAYKELQEKSALKAKVKVTPEVARPQASITNGDVWTSTLNPLLSRPARGTSAIRRAVRRYPIATPLPTPSPDSLTFHVDLPSEDSSEDE